MLRNLGYGLVLVCCFYTNANCFDDEFTHPKMTEKAIESSNLDTYLKNNLGLSGGILSSFTSVSTDTVLTLLKKGSTDEDTSPSRCRASNHFHDPTKPWDQAGLTGYQGPLSLLVDARCSATPYTQKFSNVIWATNFTSPEGSKKNTNNDNGWDIARKYYLNALTASSTTERETNFANTFYALGHVMHLLQDMAVPAHVRNDFWSHFSFTTQNGEVPYASPFELYVKLHPSSITNSTPVSLTRLTDYWDANQYDGSNPAVTGIMMGGLSEYTNANFVSEYTLFKNFTYPSPATSARVENIFIQDPINVGSTVPRKYYLKTGDGDTGYLLAGVGSLQVFKKNYLGKTYTTIDEINTIIPPMDNYVHSDYADRLLPKAVGYSAGLLNYFFSGMIFMEKSPQNAGKYIIKNESGEKMEGTFALYYDDASGNRNAVPGASWTLSINPNSTCSPVTFTEPTSPAPKEKGKYILVFNGMLGVEAGAVVGREVTLSCGGSSGTITGPDKAFTGKATQYTLNWPDAVGNVTWSTDSPVTSIWGDNNGATIWIQSYGSCSYNQGATKITATDACGTQTEYTVQAGTWVLVSSTGVKCSYACETISGSFKTEYWWKGCCDGNSNNCAGCKAECGGNPIGGLPPCGSVQSGTCPLPCGTNCCWCYNTFGVFNYEWRCQ